MTQTLRTVDAARQRATTHFASYRDTVGWYRYGVGTGGSVFWCVLGSRTLRRIGFQGGGRIGRSVRPLEPRLTVFGAVANTEGRLELCLGIIILLAALQLSSAQPPSIAPQPRSCAKSRRARGRRARFSQDAGMANPFI